jgi:hypothetical protein
MPSEFLGVEAIPRTADGKRLPNSGVPKIVIGDDIRMDLDLEISAGLPVPGNRRGKRSVRYFCR